MAGVIGSLPNVREWLRGSPDYSGVVGRSSRMSGIGRVTLLVVREWWEALSDVRELLGGPP